jgi:hypothetical protein
MNSTRRHKIPLKRLFVLTVLVLICVASSAANDCTLPLFGAPYHFWNGEVHTVRTAVADFNNDGKLDIAATAHDNRFVGIFIGDGTGNFVRQTVLSAGTFNVPPAAGDFNNDGNQDLAVGSVDGTVWIFLGFGNGHFASPARYADGPGYAYEMAAADFNHDNKLDLAIGHQSGALAIMLGNGQGGFSLANTYLSGLGPVKVVKSDFNNDGNVDLITANDGGTSSLLLGNGDGTFVVSNAPTVAYDANYANSGFAVGDFNHDGTIDYGTSGSGNTIVVFYGDGQGHFPSSHTFSSTANKDPHAADVDGDGNLDIVGTGYPNAIAAYLLGDGMGGFGSATSFPVGTGPQGSSIADFNNDGKLDVVTPNYEGGDITVLINNGGNVPDTSPPVITAPDILAYATAPAGLVVSYSIVASDDSGKNPSISCSIPSGSTFPVGSTVVTCQATDPCGHTATASFNVTVIDQPPVLSLPDNISVTATVSSGTIVNYSVSATDVVSGALPVTCIPPSGSTFPLGQTTVNCSATDGAGNTSTGSFNVNVFGCIGCKVPTFAPFISYPIGTNLNQRVITADFDNDGNQDLATPGYYPATATILWGDGAGNFPTQTQFPIGGFSVSLVAGDFNNDNKLDLAVPSFDENNVYLFLGDGARGFSAPIISDAGTTPYAVTKGDFNRDGKLDLAVVGEYSETLSILLGNGAGSFAQPIQYEISGQNPKGLNTADFNGDNKPDIVVTNMGSNNLSIFYGDGDGQFSPRQDINVGGGTVNIDPWIADFNNDGRPDIGLETNYSQIVVLLTGANGQLTQVNTPFSPIQIDWIAAADLNNDGNQDFLMSEGGIGDEGRIAVHLGDGHGQFSSSIDLPVLENPTGIAIGDFNRDGKSDIAISDYFFASVSVILNTTVSNIAALPTGSNVSVQTTSATLTFDNVTGSGTATVTPIDPTSVGEVPGGFSVSDSVAYEIATTATFTGSVTLAFKVPGPISQDDFNSLAILHNVNGTLVDVTASTPARDYSSLTIYATTNSFSPFYLARRGTHIKSLFDRSKAYKRGSTTPIKLQVLNASNANLSSSNTSLVTRDLRLMSGNTLAPIEDSGNANPDYAFRYDSTLGGAGGGYIFNLSTKGLAPGQYVLSFYVGTERSFFFTVKFEVK